MRHLLSAITGASLMLAFLYWLGWKDEQEGRLVPDAYYL